MGILGSILAARQGSGFSSRFKDIYRQIIGSYPPDSAVSAIQRSVTIIHSHVGGGRSAEAYGAEKLSKAIDEYACAVGYDEEKCQFGLYSLLTECMKNPQKVARGYSWAADTIYEGLARYCPSFLD